MMLVTNQDRLDAIASDLKVLRQSLQEKQTASYTKWATDRIAKLEKRTQQIQQQIKVAK